MGGQVVANYESMHKGMDQTLAPRPYLHPITTLKGVVVTDFQPEDHRWHMGLSLAMPDVNGHNLWGGRTYVRDQGYTWLDDHGQIKHYKFDIFPPAPGVREELTWHDRYDDVIMTERRELQAHQVDALTWQLELSWKLTPVEDRVVLGSPATNGRPDGAGYGGCFLRLAKDEVAEVRAGELRGEAEVNGCTAEEIEWTGSKFRIVARGGPRWFVRTGIYPGICAAWAFDEKLVIEKGETFSGGITLLISDLE